MEKLCKIGSFRPVNFNIVTSPSKTAVLHQDDMAGTNIGSFYVTTHGIGSVHKNLNSNEYYPKINEINTGTIP